MLRREVRDACSEDEYYAMWEIYEWSIDANEAITRELHALGRTR